MNGFRYLFLSLFSGGLLSLAWYGVDLEIALFIGFVPLLFLEDEMSSKNKNRSLLFFIYSNIAFLTWNIIDTWWIGRVSLFGAVAVIVINTLLMSLAFQLFHVTKGKLGKRIGYISLGLYWIAFEYLFLRGELYWSWLNLGVGLGNSVKLIQWFEFTGTLGGTLWILVVNVMIFNGIKSFSSDNIKKSLSFLILCFIVIIVPIIISFNIYKQPTNSGKGCKIVLIQPNINPYTEKFKAISQQEQVNRILCLANSVADGSIDYFIAPETAINDSIWEDSISKNKYIIQLKNYLKAFPRSTFIIGATTYKLYNKPNKTYTSRKFKDSNYYFDVFNTAIQIDSSSKISLYHKSKLVIGVEKVPYGKYLGFFDNSLLKIGGSFGSMGVQENRDVFEKGQDFKLAPVICYESAYGEYVTDFVKKGANIIAVLTNDGWWIDSPGYEQHFMFARIRAIETRRDIARSANTGISAFISSKGEILKLTKWWKPVAIKSVLYTNNYKTFYVQYGDLIGFVALIFSIVLILFYLFRCFKEKL